METLLAPFRLSNVKKQWENATAFGKTPVEICGTDGYGRYYTMDALSENRVKVIVTYNEDRAKEIVNDYRFFDRNVLYYPSKDVLFYSADIHGHTILRQRMEVVKSLIEGTATTVVLSIDALLNKMITLAESGSAPNTDVAIAQGVHWSYQFTFNRQDYYSTRTSYSHFRYLANSECAVMLSDLPEQFRKW